MEKRLYSIYMPHLAAELRAMGFKLVKTTPNYKKPQFDIFWFEDTEELRNSIPVAVNKIKSWKPNF